MAFYEFYSKIHLRTVCSLRFLKYSVKGGSDPRDPPAPAEITHLCILHKILSYKDAYLMCTFITYFKVSFTSLSLVNSEWGNFYGTHWGRSTWVRAEQSIWLPHLHPHSLIFSRQDFEWSLWCLSKKMMHATQNLLLSKVQQRKQTFLFYLKTAWPRVGWCIIPKLVSWPKSA